jgi:hypothetical protein
VAWTAELGVLGGLGGLGVLDVPSVTSPFFCRRRQNASPASAAPIAAMIPYILLPAMMLPPFRANLRRITNIATW